ncbi:MAG: hypothetical protein L0Z49_04960, partial [Actinobacteria bacterium]|nr:hypothetical protein [Actinomycetota bacterium]
MDSHVDHVAGKKTKTLEVQTTAPGTLTGSRLVYTKNSAKTTIDVLLPSGFEFAQIAGFLDAQGIVYPESETDARDDSLAGVSRAEINPPAGQIHDDFLLVYFLSSTASTAPTPTLIKDGLFVGATVNSIDLKMRVGDSHQAVVGTPDVTPPATPTNLVPTAGDAQVSLNWDDNTEPDLAGYYVYRQEKIAGIYQTELRIASPTSSAYVDATAENGKTYRYRVSAFDNAAVENESAPTAYTADQTPTGGGPPPPGPPSAPTGVHAIGGNAQVTADWNDNPESGVAYNVYRERFIAGAWESETIEALSVGRPYLDLDVGNGLTYRYRIGAVTVNGESPRSDYSNEVTPNQPPPPPDTTPPAAPTGLVAVPGSSEVSLDWNSNTETDLARYRVYRATKSGGVYGAFSQIAEI